jgi:hypothetical protein
MGGTPISSSVGFDFCFFFRFCFIPQHGPPSRSPLEKMHPPKTAPEKREATTDGARECNPENRREKGGGK